MNSFIRLDAVTIFKDIFCLSLCSLKSGQGDKPVLRIYLFPLIACQRYGPCSAFFI